MPRPWPPNPYDFSAPAAEDKFGGRAAERAIIRRFADSISETTAAHLLIHGRRGIGKTSLIQETSRELRSRGILPASLTLDEHSAGESAFLVACVLAISDAVIRAGGLGGPAGPFASALEDALLGIPTDRSLGPLRVATWASQTHGNRVADLLVTNDIAELVDAAREVDFEAVVLLIDEGDNLTQEPVTVQRYRNLIVVPGILSSVLVGTDEMAAGLDAALTPAGRHFRRLELRALADANETKECLERPLNAAGVHGAHLLNAAVVSEVHAITGGRPFEIALLAHVMYEDMVSREDDQLVLNAAILEQASRILRPSVEEEATLNRLRALAIDDLELVARHCVDPQLTATELATIACLPGPLTVEAINARRATVLREWNRVAELGLAEVLPEFLAPRFGDFARLYLKYRAVAAGPRKGGAAEGPYSARLAGSIREQIRLAAIDCNLHVVAVFSRAHLALEAGADPGEQPALDAAIAGDVDALLSRGSLTATLPAQFGDERDFDDEATRWAIGVLAFEIQEDGFSVVILVRNEDDAWRLDEFEARVRDLLASLAAYRVEPGRVTTGAFTGRAWSDLGLAYTAAVLLQAGTKLWFKRRPAAVRFIRDVMPTIRPALDKRQALPDSALVMMNNFAFVELSAGNPVEAYELLSRAATRGGLGPGRRVPVRLTLLCNLAAAAAAVGRYVEAVSYADDALALEIVQGRERASILCVYSPDPAWIQHPLLVEHPNEHRVALGTKAAALAMMGD